MAKKKEALNLHATLKEIHTMSYPGKEGYFMIGMDTMDEHSGEMVNLYLEIPFADFYSWINEDTLKKMKQQYTEKFLNINL